MFAGNVAPGPGFGAHASERWHPITPRPMEGCLAHAGAPWRAVKPAPSTATDVWNRIRSPRSEYVARQCSRPFLIGGIVSSSARVMIWST